MSKKKNLVVDISGRKWINDSIKKSNPAYKNGYIPYFIRRRMDFTDGKGSRDIVDDDYIKIEYTKLHSYCNPKMCSPEHIHDLIEYMKGKNTLFMPGIIPVGEETKIVKEGDDYRLANMAFRCLSYYIDNAVSEAVKENEEQQHFGQCILKYINKDDLVAWITTCFKVGHETGLAKTHAWILHQINRDVDGNDLLHKEIIERMVTYILVDSKKDEFADEPYLVFSLMKTYPERVVEIASGFRKEEAGLIDLAVIDAKFIKKYAYQIICNGHQVFGKKELPRFGVPAAYDFISEFMKNDIPEDVKESNAFDIAILEQDGLEAAILEEFEDNDLDGFCSIEDLEGCCSVNELNERIRYYSGYTLSNFDVMQYMYFIPTRGYKMVSVHKYLLNDERFFKVFAYTMLRSIVTKENGFGELIGFLLDNDNLTAVIDSLEKFIPDQYGKLDKKKHDFMFPFVLLLNGSADTEGTEGVIAKSTRENMLERTKLIRFAIEHIDNGTPIESYYLRAAMKTGTSFNSVMRLASLDRNIDFLEETYKTMWLELPTNVITNMTTPLIPNRQFEFLEQTLTTDQWKSYPFTAEMMRERRELFEQFLDKVNVDRYVLAYGLDWVEERHPISLTDIVESGSYVNTDLIERYLDIILLDENLRGKFLHNKEAMAMLSDTDAAKNVLSSDVFPNTTKCEFVYAILKSNPASRMKLMAIKDTIMKSLVGSGFIGRALSYELKLFKNEEILNSNVFDITGDD